MDKATTARNFPSGPVVKTAFPLLPAGCMGCIFGWGTKICEAHNLPKEKDTIVEYIPKIKQVTSTITYEVKKKYEVVESGSLYCDKGTLPWSYKS